MSLWTRGFSHLYSLVYSPLCLPPPLPHPRGWTSPPLLHHEVGRGGSAHTTDFRVGWSVARAAMPAIYSSTGLETWLQIFRLQGHWHPIFYLLWVLFQMSCWIHLPALATDSRLKCASEALGNFWNFHRKTKCLTKSRGPGVSDLETGSLAPRCTSRKSQN